MTATRLDATPDPQPKLSYELAFQLIALPVLQGMGLLPRGQVVSAEGTSQDKRAGIDYLISGADGTQTSLAVRTQWKPRPGEGLQDYGTFTIRYRTEKGNLSELTKRYRSVVAGAQYPTLTVQSYVDRDTWTLVNSYVVRTDDLYRHVIHQGATGDTFLLCTCATRPRWAPGGAEFVPVAITEEGRRYLGTKATLLGHGVPVAMTNPRAVGLGLGL
jgi:hypothetical protein